MGPGPGAVECDSAGSSRDQGRGGLITNPDLGSGQEGAPCEGAEQEQGRPFLRRDGVREGGAAHSIRGRKRTGGGQIPMRGGAGSLWATRWGGSWGEH